MSLEELLDITVITGSGREERMSESPAIISVISRQDVDDYRPLNLYERLSLLPGIEMLESYYSGTQPTFRGLLQTHYVNKSLFMINGHQLFTPVNGTYYLFQVPQTAIDRVEVMRGPASSLYATNAYAGVVNVITRPATDEPHAEVYAMGGSFYTRQFGASATGSFKGVGLYLFGQFNDSDGYDFVAERDEDGLTDVRVKLPYETNSAGYETDYYSVYGGGTYKGFRLNAGFFDTQQDKFGLIPTVLSTGKRNVRGWLADASYDLELAPQQRLVATARYDNFEKPDERTFYPPVTAAAAQGQEVTLRWISHKVGGEIRYRGAFFEGEALNILAGVQVNYLAAPYYVFIYTQDVVDTTTGENISSAGDVWESPSGWTSLLDYVDSGSYLNADYRIIDELKIVGGLLVNYNSIYGTFFAPRGAVVMAPAEQFAIKALYGRSYRAPTIFEQSVDTPGIIYGGNLARKELGLGKVRPEILDSIELVGEWRPGKVSTRLVAYYMWTSDVIGRFKVVPAGSSLGNTTDTAAYANGSGDRYAGVELEVEGRPITQLRLFFNTAARMSWNEDWDRNPYWYAPILANAGATWRPLEILGFSMTGQFISPRWGVMQEGTSDERDVHIDPYFLLNARVMVQPHPIVELSIAALNILNMRYNYPEYIRQRIDTVPGGPGFQLYGEMRLRF
jgi:iron complex outermembrane receptor protein